MALEGTHIRFALEFQESLGITNLSKYFSGSIYPDSRYLTGALRVVTHPTGFELKTFSSNDFNKGWYTHLLADKIQSQIYFDWFKELLSDTDVHAGTPVWNEITALKILQDMFDVRQFPIQQYLSYLDYIESPNNEDSEAIRKFNTIFQSMYKNPNSLKLEHQYDMWLEMGLSDEIKNNLMALCERYQKSPIVQNMVPTVFEEMIRRARLILTQ